MRSWKILEEGHPYESYRHGGKHKMMGMDKEYEEAFEDGYRCGFGEAMELVEEEKYGMGFRGEGGSSSYRSGSGSGRGGSSRGGSYGNRMGYREEDDDESEMMMGERRRRRSNGRYM